MIQPKKFIAVFMFLVFILGNVSFGAAISRDSFSQGNILTGKAISQNTNVSIVVSGNPPTSDDISTIPDPSITEAGISNVLFYATVSDPDGTSNIQLVNASFSKSAQTTRTNATCVKVANLNATQANYSCIISYWYWDGAGTWDVNVQVKDIDNNIANRAETLTLLETSAIVLSPNALSWATIAPGSVNQTSNNDPTLINNTGNYNVPSGNIQVKALDLIGQTNGAYFIPAANFTSGVNTGGNAECLGTALVNNTFSSITGSILPAGNNSAGNGQEQLYYCLKQAPSNLISQTYSTSILGSWVVKIV
jgi:hypothetical protein